MEMGARWRRGLWRSRAWLRAEFGIRDSGYARTRSSTVVVTGTGFRLSRRGRCRRRGR